MSPALTALNWLREHMKYNTVKIVSIKNFQLSLLFRACQLGIILYILVSVIVVKKGYQRTGAVTGSTNIKVKGSSYNKGGLPWYNMTTQPLIPDPLTNDYTQIFDSSDLVYPSAERDAVFITSNMYVTPNQVRDKCYPGSPLWFNFQFKPEVADEYCKGNCTRGTLRNELETQSGGVWTGGYILKVDNSSDPLSLTNCYCELFTWCPDENIPKKPDNRTEFHLYGIEDWTVSFTQSVQFHQFGIVTNNAVPKDNPTPPIRTVKSMLEEAGLTYEGVRAKGAVLVMQSSWNCNLDFSVDDCYPEVSFVSLNSVFNFRRTIYTSPAGLYGARDLMKQYGIRILIVLSGVGGKFDLAALLTNIGAGIGLLAVASLVADFAAVNLLGQRALYEKAKFKQVEVTDDGRARGISQDREKKQANGNDLEMAEGNNGASTAHGMSAPIVPEGDVASDREESWGKRRA